MWHLDITKDFCSNSSKKIVINSWSIEFEFQIRLMQLFHSNIIFGLN